MAQDSYNPLDERYYTMTQSPIRRLVVKLAIPTMLSMVVTALYNLVDAVFVGHLSTEATAGIGISFAYMTFIQAIGFFFGHGSGNHISRALGAREYDDASRIAAVGVITPIILGVIAAIFSLIFLTPLTTMLGATPDVVPYANDYLRYIIIATPLMMSALTLNNQLRLQGNARFAMIGLTSGAVLNIVLDPLFIFGFDMGVTGASLATAISQTFAWGLLFWGTTRPQSVHISIKNFKPSWYCYNEIFRGGLPSLCRQAFNCISAILLNRMAVKYAVPGQEAATVAAFAVVSRTMMFAFSLVLGFTQGFQPVCGFNYGAKKYDRVKDSYIFALQVSTIILLFISILGFIFAPTIISWFRDEDPEMMKIGVRVLRWQCISFPLIGISTCTNMLFQNIRMTFRSTLLSVGRQGLFFIPTILILPHFIGLDGVVSTQAIADVLTCLLSIPYAVWIIRVFNRQHAEQQAIKIE